MKLNHWSNIFYAIVIANVIVQHVIQINNGNMSNKYWNMSMQA